MAGDRGWSLDKQKTGRSPAAAQAGLESAEEG